MYLHINQTTLFQQKMLIDNLCETTKKQHTESEKFIFEKKSQK